MALINKTLDFDQQYRHLVAEMKLLLIKLNKHCNCCKMSPLRYVIAASVVPF